MKKFSIFVILFSTFIMFFSCCFGKSYICSDSTLNMYKSDLERCRGNSYCYYSEEELERRVAQEQAKYDSCLEDKYRTDKFQELYLLGAQYITQGNLIEGCALLEEAKEYAESSDLLYLNPTLGDVYYTIAHNYFTKTAYPSAIEYYKKYLNLYSNDADTLYNIGVSYVKMGEYSNGIERLNKAKKYSTDAELDGKINSALSLALDIEQQMKDMENAKTTDKYNYKQYYLENMNIYDAWDKIGDKGHKVTIAIIDDGVNINHKDLTKHIYYNTNEIAGNGVDDDKNGYIDDNNGWNFVSNSNNMTPAGSHGTMVAGIIGARINNSEGIAGIIPNDMISIMPLIVFDWNGNASSQSIIKAMNYAIDNGADIINLSLGGQQFQYTNTYDEVFKKAYNNGVIIVVAAGNGDTLTNASVGVNTSVSKLSPVCNEYKYGTTIGVGSLNKNGGVSSWSNYGSCVDIYAYGEGIYTTTISNSDPYVAGTGTSFSAPMISAIIGLGYNKYGKVSPDIVYKALVNSTKSNVVDAVKYLDNLQTSIGELSDAIGWMYSKNLTIFNDPVSFMADNGLRRDEASKFFVRYARDILGKVPDYSKTDCNFKDLNKARPDLKDVIVEACQLGLFQGYKGNFMPTDKLTNAQAIAVFMRLLDGYKDESGDHFANEYYAMAREMGILKGTNLENRAFFDRDTTRGDVAIMLYRGQLEENDEE